MSDQHPWFVEAHDGGPGLADARPLLVPPGTRRRRRRAAERLDARTSATSAWTRTKNPDGTPGDWYLHLFAPAQPDLNWEHPAVRAEHEEILRFWFDRGAAGIRIDSAALAIKDPALPDLDRGRAGAPTRSSTATRSTTSTGRGGRSPTPTTRPGR